MPDERHNALWAHFTQRVPLSAMKDDPNVRPGLRETGVPLPQHFDNPQGMGRRGQIQIRCINSESMRRPLDHDLRIAGLVHDHAGVFRQTLWHLQEKPVGHPA
jgi:hypothetical protein